MRNVPVSRSIETAPSPGREAPIASRSALTASDGRVSAANAPGASSPPFFVFFAAAAPPDATSTDRRAFHAAQSQPVAWHLGAPFEGLRRSDSAKTTG